MASDSVTAGVAQQSIGQGIQIERLRASLRHVSALPFFQCHHEDLCSHCISLLVVGQEGFNS